MSGKMLQGISACVRGYAISTRKHHPLVRVYTFLSRDFSSAGVENGERSEKVGRCIDQSFTAAHCDSDGRKFQFATVVVKAMRQGESPLHIWEQARALIGGNSPTLAVAFVSKPTISALRTVRVLASQLSASSESGSQQSPLSPCSQVSSSSSSIATGRSGVASSSLSSDFAEASQSSSVPKEALNRSEHVPLIGCVMDDFNGEFKSTDDVEGTQVSSRGATSGLSQFGLDGGLGQGTSRHRGGLEARLFDQRLRDDGFSVESSADEDGEEDTLSDWEALCSEYDEEAIQVLESKAESEDEEEDDATNGADEVISKEGLVSFLNALVRRGNPYGESGGRGDLRAMVRSEQIVGMQNRQLEDDVATERESIAGVASEDGLVSELRQRLNSSDGKRQRLQRREGATHSGFGRDSLFGDVEGTVTVEPINNGDKAEVSGSDPGQEDENYKLVLCLGYMPGVKAAAFHSSTTGLPRLTDLENAVTDNNPHMLLFGAPGFVFPDFIQRLVTVFPASCRAGAFLAPLFTSKKSHWTRVAAEQKFGPLFFGTHFSTTGVVGLAISSKEKESSVPRGAFAEFARMSLGMPRIRGYMFLDEAISRKLFLPENVSLRHSSVVKGSPVAPSTVLDQLSRQLLRESAVPLSRISVADIATDPGKEFVEVDGSLLGSTKSRSWDLASSNPVDQEPRSLDRLPLALLDAVLFPGWSMPFYLYEPCYRVMVRRCIEQGRPFGLSSMVTGSWSAEAIESGEIFGTIAKLKVHTIERDCRSYVIAHGIRRFRVVNESKICPKNLMPTSWSRPPSKSMYRLESIKLAWLMPWAEQVQFFDDRECDSLEEKHELLDLAKEAVSLCCQVMSEAQTTPGLVKSTHDPKLASFAVGHVLNVPTRVKRRWLKMVNTKTRLQEQITFLKTKVTT